MARNERYRELLGKSGRTAEISALLRQYGILRSPRLPLDDPIEDGPHNIAQPQDWLANRAHGIEFGFEDEAAFLGAPPADWGTGPMVLTQVYLYADHPQHSVFHGSWPYGILPQDDRETVSWKMDDIGAPKRSRNRDTWVFDNCLMTADFGADDQRLAFLVFLARPKYPPPDPTLVSRCPTPKEVARCVGKPQSDADLVKVFSRFGAPFNHPSNLSAGEAEFDFREDFGAIADFAATQNGNELVLVRFQILGDRRYGAAMWPQALPGRLTFESGWDDIVTSAGRSPDDVAESEFDVLAYWRTGQRVWEVEYSTMENKISSFSLLFSPE